MSKAKTAKRKAAQRQPRPSPIQQFIGRCLEASGESPAQFAVRCGKAPRHFYANLNGRRMNATGIETMLTALGVELVCGRVRVHLGGPSAVAPKRRPARAAS